MTGSKVLVVDDEPTVREVVVGYLRRDGHEVAEAGDGYTALELLDSDPPDLVVLDMMLPRSSGLLVLEKLAEERISVPVIMVTANIQNKIKDEAMALGCMAFLNKTGDATAIKTLLADIKED